MANKNTKKKNAEQPLEQPMETDDPIDDDLDISEDEEGKHRTTLSEYSVIRDKFVSKFQKLNLRGKKCKQNIQSLTFFCFLFRRDTRRWNLYPTTSEAILLHREQGPASGDYPHRKH
jgi:hypothetical protein